MVRCRVLPCLHALVLLLFVGPALLIGQAQAQTQSPRIFYTDLVSGPASGGQNSQGAFVTIYGNNFGSTRGSSTVTLNGKAVATYPVWTNNKIAVQVASGSTTGNFVVNVNGVPSNGLPFTVRTGRIFFVSTTGRDANSGSYASPWATLAKARSSVAAGDIVYAMNGVQQTGADLSSASLSISKSGTRTSPIAFVAYPGATVTIGSTTGQSYGVRNSAATWNVIAGMTIRGALTGVDMTSGYNWRLVGNDISCPNGSGVGGCVNGASAGGTKVYGNNVHDTGSTTSSSISQYSGINFTNTSTLDIGWNEVGKTGGCDAIKVRSSSQLNYGVQIHDNFVHDARCSGVVVGNMDTSKGAVKIFNNLIVRTGTGPAPGGVESEAYAGVYIAPSSNGVAINNNTLYDCGARKGNNTGCALAKSSATLKNNILNVLAGEWYVGVSSPTPTGSNNLCYGDDTCPSALTSSVSADPLFSNPAGNDFRLKSGSPAIDKGTNTAVPVDLAGTTRGATYDIGAYEYASGTSGPVTSVNLTAAPTSISFGNVTVGQSATQGGTLTNSSTTTSITVSAADVTGSGFSVSGLTFPATIAPGASVNYTAKFTPAASGTASGSISFVSDATNSPATVGLSGSGTTAAVGTLSANPTSLAFGSITAGTNSTKTVTLSNSGSANLTISAASVTGTGYTISGITTPLTLTSGQAATLSVTFAPTAAATYSGTVTLTSNASNTSLSIPLSGTGTAVTTSHSVALTWTASTTSGVTGYNVYRSTTSGSGYTKINASATTGTTYTDSTVANATTYYYVIRAIGSNGMESANSSQVTAVVP